MLSLHLDAAEEAPAWIGKSTGFAAGCNTIEPFRHPALEDFALASSDQLLVVVRERCARAPRPERATGVGRGALAAAPPGALQDVAVRMRNWPMQWLTLVVSGRGRDLSAVFETGEWGSAPVFALTRGANLWGSWDPVPLLQVARGARLDELRAAHFLAAFETTYSSATMLTGMVMQTERSRMTWHADSGPRPALEITYPAAVRPPLPRPLVDGADPPQAFWEILTASLRRWLEGYGEGVVVEVSGGLDSALVAAAAAELAAGPLRSCGIALAGPSRDDERERRRIVADRLGLDDHEVDILDHLPFAPGACRIDGAAVPWEECYYEAVDAMLGGATAAGATLVLTGLGGDELCGRRPGERAAAGTGSGAPRSPWLDVPAFLTAATREAYDDTCRRLERAPQPLAAVSVPECIAIGSAMYMRRGTWAVHPLATPQLIRFCAQLPREWRHGRRVQRELLARLGYPPRLIHPAIGDDFMPALAAAFRHRARALVRRLFAAPVLADLGFVDRDRLVSSYDAWCADGHDVDGAMPFYSATVLELTARSLAA